MGKKMSEYTQGDPASAADSLDRLVGIVEQQSRILEAQARNIALLQSQSWEQARMLEVLGRIELRDLLIEVRRVIQNRQLSMMDTMDQLVAGKSIARWGDGEIKLMVQPEFDLMYQKSNTSLAADLRRMLAGYDMTADRLLLALPTVFTTRLWMGIWSENWHVLGPILEVSTASWGNTHISRPPFFQRHGTDAVAAWRRVWEGKRICVVAGRGSRFELLPELFDNVAGVIRVDSEPSDAYVTLPDLKRRLHDVDDVDLFLLALGPSGTVMAGHLASEAGGARQAIDIGHLASSYLNVFKGGKVPEQLPQKR
ncbi:GT-D fold domain-containing glycosyltransferase [Arthrobacter sp. N1]|uniref:GT-D fold domain-containing glycosyltransferase n=1 Tax=Arthrobacter sp. N1 TaxID=619291 RepID=UPI003BB003F9